MTTTPRTTASVSSPAELITLLPYQLGYRPRSSLVAVLLRQAAQGETTVGPVMRVDLPAPDGPEAGQLIAGVGRRVLEVVHAHDATGVQLVAFEDEDREEDATSELAYLAVCLEAGPAPAVAVCRVRGERWCRLDLDGQPTVETTLFPTWEPLPAPADVPAVAELVLSGRGAAPDREALSRRLDEPGPVLTHAAVRQALAGPGPEEEEPLVDEEEVPDRERADRWAAVWAYVVRNGPEELAAGELALLVRSLRSLSFRDALLWWLTPGDRAGWQGEGQPEVAAVLRAMMPAEPPDPPDLRERLQALAVRLPPEHRTPVLTVLGVTAWWHGEGTLANIAAERALRQEPTYRLAMLLDLALDRAVPPPGYPSPQR